VIKFGKFWTRDFRYVEVLVRFERVLRLPDFLII
jgi:hypothetical protein